MHYEINRTSGYDRNCSLKYRQKKKKASITVQVSIMSEIRHPLFVNIQPQSHKEIQEYNYSFAEPSKTKKYAVHKRNAGSCDVYICSIE